MVLSLPLGNERVDEMERPQVVSAKAEVYSSGSSSSGGGEHKKYRDPEAEIPQLREELKCHEKVGKEQVAQCEPAGEEGGFEQAWKMEVDEETGIKIKSWMNKKKLQKQLRDIEKFTDIDQRARARRKVAARDARS